MDLAPEDPFELAQPGLTPVPEGQGRQAHDDNHGDIRPRSTNSPLRRVARYRGLVPSAPQSRSGRYEDLTTGELADVVERGYDRNELPDWELVFELSRRAMAGEQLQDQSVLGASRRG